MRLKKLTWILIPSLILFLNGCLMPIKGKHSERQLRMIRCEQYIGEQRDKCMNGEPVNIREYKEDVQDYKEGLKNSESAPN